MELGLEQRLALRHAAERLEDRFAGRLNVETIERFLTDSYDQISEGARLPNWLPLLAERSRASGCGRSCVWRQEPR